MKAILINATEKTVTDIELDDPDTSLELQDLIGPIMCGWTWYDASGFPRNILYVNEEGMLPYNVDYFRLINTDKVGFCPPCGPSFWYGTAVILGVTKAGESTNTTIEAADLEIEFGGALPGDIEI